MKPFIVIFLVFLFLFTTAMLSTCSIFQKFDVPSMAENGNGGGNGDPTPQPPTPPPQEPPPPDMWSGSFNNMC